MKPLKNMNNTDKGKLLAALFPEQLQGILDSLTTGYTFLKENENNIRSAWDNGLLTFDFWLAQACEVAAMVSRHGKDLKKSSSFFGERLFNGYNAIYSIDCIVKQAAALPPLPENIRYRLAVKLLFEHYTATP